MVSADSSHTYKFGITMPCKGCSGAITNVLSKLEGVESFSVSLEDQTATVVTKDDTLTYDTVLKTIKKTGKTVNTGEADNQSMSTSIDPAT
ncbi:Metal homeostasis factor ATX1 [Golovinomyces cichoracearum]|uniref:Metal homeostasis factor ATX1 n=1 Tax=Golovinomyces cichoracearum TaxID=62708 RepID=A0A420H752_9PEZI|nr:Metal homeostasis factor ATX1 [Golovinomyces cichoracearum]